MPLVTENLVAQLGGRQEGWLIRSADWDALVAAGAQGGGTPSPPLAAPGGVGGLRRRDPNEKIHLESGDAFVFGGPARLRYHGVSRVLPSTAPAGLPFNSENSAPVRSGSGAGTLTPARARWAITLR